MNFKISFCTTCMNRVEHLKETLPQNILANKNYKNVEFVLLDYNSSDGLKNYVKSELAQYITAGKLSYYRTDEPVKYNMSHSRNMVFNLANGDILCNIDADNFTGEGFANYINKTFNDKEEIVLSTHQRIEKKKKRRIGKNMCEEKDFLAVNGYDESMIYYGFDDYDFLNRLQLNGLKNEPIENDRYLSAISHSNESRMANSGGVNDLEKLLIAHINPATSVLCLLLKDGSYSKATIINNRIHNGICLPTETKKHYIINIR
ncbi:glycosyltransferase family 2 protein [Mucilaginibacter sp. S1162]|uniref:Glycosyltransferase family 2 protein n=1 Tax=Mucilaginibacter humi TaxID=2732510 RepID=A0ABX1W494_9SPHI|nr:glycosyltransferase family A protein [Mucilaginibacter humi]NNU33105.1 glycosyltransferase family 2 protein [Mucilaginibacter humi]